MFDPIESSDSSRSSPSRPDHEPTYVPVWFSSDLRSTYNRAIPNSHHLLGLEYRRSAGRTSFEPPAAISDGPWFSSKGESFGAGESPSSIELWNYSGNWYLHATGHTRSSENQSHPRIDEWRDQSRSEVLPRAHHLTEQNFLTGGALTLRREPYVPIRQYPVDGSVTQLRAERDPYHELVGRVTPGSQTVVGVQIAFTESPRDWSDEYPYWNSPDTIADRLRSRTPSDHEQNHLDYPRDWTDDAIEYVTGGGLAEKRFDVVVRYFVFAPDPREASRVAAEVGTAFARTYASSRFPQTFVPVAFTPGDVPWNLHAFAGRKTCQSAKNPTSLRLGASEFAGLAHLQKPPGEKVRYIADPLQDLSAINATGTPGSVTENSSRDSEQEPAIEPKQEAASDQETFEFHRQLRIGKRPEGYRSDTVTTSAQGTEASGEVALQSVTDFDYDDAVAIRNYGVTLPDSPTETTVESVQLEDEVTGLETTVTTEAGETVVGRPAYKRFFREQEDTVYLGLDSDEQPSEPVGLDIDSLTHHGVLYGDDDEQLVELQSQMVEQLARAEQGCICLDHDGTLADTLLERLPTKRLDDVLYVDPASDDPGVQLQLNPLEQLDASSPTTGAKEDDTGGFAADLLALVETHSDRGLSSPVRSVVQGVVESMQQLPETYTLADLHTVLRDKVARRRLFAAADDARLAVRQHLHKQFRAANERSLRRVADILDQWLSGPAGDLFATAETPPVDIGELLRDGRILIVAPSGSDGTNRLVTTTLLHHVWDAATRGANRDDDPEPFFTLLNGVGPIVDGTADLSNRLDTAREGQVGVLLRPTQPELLPQTVRTTLDEATRHRISLRTESKDTLQWLDDILPEAGYSDRLLSLSGGDALIGTSRDLSERKRRDRMVRRVELFESTPSRRLPEFARSRLQKLIPSENGDRSRRTASPFAGGTEVQLAFLEAVWETQIRESSSVALQEITTAFDARAPDEFDTIEEGVRVPAGTITIDSDHDLPKEQTDDLYERVEFDGSFHSLAREDVLIRITDEGKRWLFDETEYEDSEDERYRQVARELFAGLSLAGHHPTVNFTTGDAEATPGFGLVSGGEKPPHTDTLGANPRFRILDGDETADELATAVIRDYENDRHTVFVPRQGPERQVDRIVREAVDVLKDPFLKRGADNHPFSSGTMPYVRQRPFDISDGSPTYSNKYPVVWNSPARGRGHWILDNGKLTLYDSQSPDGEYLGTVELTRGTQSNNYQIPIWCGYHENNEEWVVKGVEGNNTYWTRSALEDDWTLVREPALASLAETPDTITEPRVEILQPGAFSTTTSDQTVTAPGGAIDAESTDSSQSDYTKPLDVTSREKFQSISVRASKLPLIAQPDSYKFLHPHTDWSESRVSDDISWNRHAGNHHIRTLAHLRADVLDSPDYRWAATTVPFDSDSVAESHRKEPLVVGMERYGDIQCVDATSEFEIGEENFIDPLFNPKNIETTDLPCDPTRPEYWVSIMASSPADSEALFPHSFLLSQIATHSGVSMETAEDILDIGVEAGVLINHPLHRIQSSEADEQREVYCELYGIAEKQEYPGRYLDDPYQYNRDFWLRKIFRYDIPVSQKPEADDQYEVDRTALERTVRSDFELKLAAGKEQWVFERDYNVTSLTLSVSPYATPYITALWEFLQAKPSGPIKRETIVEALHEFYSEDRRKTKSAPEIHDQIDRDIQRHSLKRVPTPDGESADAEFLALTTWDEAVEAHRNEHRDEQQSEPDQTDQEDTSNKQSQSADTGVEEQSTETRDASRAETAPEHDSQPDQTESTQADTSTQEPDEGETPSSTPSDTTDPTDITDFHDPAVEEMDEPDAMEEFLDRFIEYGDPEGDETLMIVKQFRQLWNEWGTLHGHDSYQPGNLMYRNFGPLIDIDYEKGQIQVSGDYRPRIYRGMGLSEDGEQLLEVLVDEEADHAVILPLDE